LRNEDFIKYDKNRKYDIIIGNPPYIRIQNLPEDTRKSMRNEYKEVITGNTDIYVYFILKCIDMLKENGKLIFIVPNSLLYNKSCKKVMDNLKESKLLEYVIDFREKKVFEGFSVYTCIIVLNKEKASERTHYFYGTSVNGTYDKIPYNEEEVESSLLKYINVKNGLATLCDDVYIIKDTELLPTLNEDYVYFKKGSIEYRVERCLTKKVLKVSRKKEYTIICPYTFENNKAKIVEENELHKYPECEKYLTHNKERLLNRDKGKKKYETWYAYGRKQGLDISDNIRIFIPSITQNIKDNIYEMNVPLFYSGLMIDIKHEFKDKTDKEMIIDALKKKEDAILKKANVKSNGWYALSKSCFDVQYISTTTQKIKK
jgi:adenine-specific DNA-methyltransferase